MNSYELMCALIREVERLREDFNEMWMGDVTLRSWAYIRGINRVRDLGSEL